MEWQKVNTTGEGLSDAEFSILDENGGIVVEGLTSDDDGNFSYDGLVPGEYTIVETVASEGYLLNSETVTFTVPESAPEAVTIEMEDFVNYQGSAQMLKVNEAEEILPGATFEVRDAEDNFVIELTSDENGRVFVENLAPGDYTFVEIASPDGYITNTEPVEFTMPAEAEGEPAVVNAGDFTNYKGSVVLEKTDVDGKPLEDAVFEIRDLENNLIRSNIISDENGLVEVDELAPGTYRFIELTAPEGYIINETIIEFTIESEAAGEPEVVEVDSLINYQGSVVLEKLNADREQLEGAVFEIRDLENNVIQSNLTSDENGLVEAADLAPGDYIFVETQAPDGYLINETPIPFTIDNTALGEPVVVDAGTATNYQGSVQWLKVDSNDEVLTGAQFNVLDEEGTVVVENVGTNENGLVEVDGLAPGTYTIQETMAVDGYLLNLAEVEFTIADRAEGRPDVVIADNFVNYQGSAQMLKVNAAGEVLEGAVFEVLDADDAIVDTVISNENGRVFVENLSPGNYSFVEISSPDGYITNTEPVEFTIADQAENEPEVVNAGDFTNYKGSVLLEKTAVDGTPLADAVFEIRDSENNLIRSNILSDENGLVEVEGLAPGTYRFIEVTAPEDYLINETPIEFTIEAEAAGEPEVVEADSLINYKGSVRLEKTDENGTPLSHAVFDIRDTDGNVVQSDLVSNDLGQVEADNLAPGDYFFVETQAPDGYLINETPIPFTIVDSAFGEPAVVEAEQAVNYQGSADWLKIDENGHTLEGAQFNVLDEGGTIVAEDLISDENGRVTVDGLAPGTYTIVETEAVDGYILNTELGGFDIPTSAEGRPETETADNFVNYQGKVLLTKTDVDGNPLEGAVFTLTHDGETIEENLVTNELGQIMVEGLAPGDYIFTEVSAPEGFIIDTTPLPFSIEAEVEGEPVLITIGDVVNYQGEILLTKVDENENQLEGAVFELRDAVGNLLRDDLISDEEGIVTVDRLAPGDYVLREIKAPTGYILNTTPIAFTIAEGMAGQPDILSLGHFTNYQGSGGVMKVDENGNPLADAEFSVFDADGNAVLTGLVSDEEGRIIIEDLAPGKYTLVETKAPAGYVLTEEVYSFEVAAEAEGKPVEFLLTVTNALEPVIPEEPSEPEEPEAPETPEIPETPSDPEDPDLPGTGEAPIYTALALSLITVGLGISFYRRRRFSE